MGYAHYVEQSSKSPATSSSKRRKTKTSAAREPTRIKWAWGTLILGLVLGIALVDFLVQNTRSVRIEFFAASGQIPIVGALLVAALAGAAVALIVGSARIRQLRHRMSKPADAGKATKTSKETSTPPAGKSAA